MKVLLIGGSGLIGSYLAPHLMEQGHEVVIVDPRAPLIDLGVKVKRLDWNITSDQTAHDALDFAKPDVIVFMASAVPDWVSSVTNPSKTMKTFQAMTSAYYAAQSVGVKRFIYLSSVPETSKHEPLSILNELVERFLDLASSSTETAMDVMILKATNVYAPGTVDKRYNFLNTLLKASASGDRLKISSADRSDFVYVGDAVKAITGAVEQGSAAVHANIRSLFARLFYISSGHPTMNFVEIIETYNRAAKALGYNLARYDIVTKHWTSSRLDMAYEESDTAALMLLTGITEEPLELEQGCHKLIEMERVLRY